MSGLKTIVRALVEEKVTELVASIMEESMSDATLDRWSNEITEKIEVGEVIHASPTSNGSKKIHQKAKVYLTVEQVEEALSEIGQSEKEAEATSRRWVINQKEEELADRYGCTPEVIRRIRYGDWKSKSAVPPHIQFELDRRAHNPKIHPKRMKGVKR